MKTKIFTLFLLFFSISFMKAQVYTYIPLVEEGARWSYAAVRRVSLTDLEANYSTYQLKGDTTINGFSYKKLLDGCSGDYLAAIREDNHRVYILKGQENEQLFFDFNLQEGDYMISGSNGGLYSVDKIDTVQIGETGRKRFVLGSGYETWIEGIGALEDFYPLQGRLLNLEDQGINYQKRDSEIVYKTDKWYFNENDCKYNGIQSTSPVSPLKLIQRKGEIELQPDVSIFESGQVYVYSMLGDLLYTQPAKRNTSITVPTGNFSKGTYIIQLIEDKTKKSWSAKITIKG